MKIKYLKHPVSLGDKKKLNKEGFKVIDIRFKPKEVEKPEIKEKPKSKSKSVK